MADAEAMRKQRVQESRAQGAATLKPRHAQAEDRAAAAGAGAAAGAAGAQ